MVRDVSMQDIVNGGLWFFLLEAVSSGLPFASFVLATRPRGTLSGSQIRRPAYNSMGRHEPFALL